MRKTIYQAISPSTVLDRISSRLRKCVDINLIGNNPVHLIVFPPESRNVVAANAIKKALSKLPISSDRIVAVGYDFTAEAREVLHEINALVFSESSFGWTDERWYAIQQKTK